MNNPIGFADYLLNTSTNKSMLRTLLTGIISIGEATRGFTLLLDNNLKRINDLESAQRDKSAQHPVIPTSIYSSLFARTIGQFEEIEENIDPLLEILRRCSTNPQLGKSLSVQKELSIEKGTNFQQLPMIPELLETHGLQTYVEQYTEQTGRKVQTTRDLFPLTLQIQSICHLLIVLFSGIRRGEANRLPVNCLDTFYENDKKHYRLCGGTFKQSEGLESKTMWVTDPIIARVVHVAQKVANLVYSLMTVSLSTSQRSDSNYPLFISLCYIPSSHRNSVMSKKIPYSNIKFLGTPITLPEQLFPKITEDDIQELEAIDPFRDWRSEDKMTIGARWHYTSHQARRSLAVYASASGLVTLQSLRRQLQHITEEMTIYYAKGSAFAKSMTSDSQDHFCKDYQAAQPEAQALAYITQILMSDEPLFGGHGAWVTKRFNENETVSDDDRATTMQRFGKGQTTYTDTAMGGCTSIEPCQKKAMRTVSACLDCAKAVIKSSKLERVIKIHRAHVKRLDPNSVEARLKKDDLAKLVAHQKRIKKKAENIL